MNSTDAAIKQINQWKLDPRRVVMEMFGLDGLTPENSISPQQEEGLEFYRRILTAKLKRQYHQPMSAQEKADAVKIGIVVHSGHGTGKTAFAAWVLIHFLVTRAYCKIPCVAPVGPQLKSNLWPEVHLWLRRSPVLREMVQWQAEKIYFKDDEKKVWAAFPRTVNVKAGSDEQAETLAGIHADSMLVVVDEGSGVPDPVFKPLEGGLTGPVNFCLMIGNPTQANGFFADAFMRGGNDWLVLHWNAEDSPLVQPSQIERMARKYGKSSNAYRIRVLGLPPLASPDTLIPWDWVMKAVGRDLPIDPSQPTTLGIDVGRELGGDDSVIVSRRGAVVQRIATYNGVDTQELAYWCLKEIQETEAAAAAIDVIGWGAGTYDVLKNLAPCAILAINVSEKAENEDLFFRLRDELWWKMRERFQAGTISIPDDKELIGELSVIRYNFSKSAKELIKVESKLELRERSVASPNKADALVLSEYAASFAGPRIRQPNARRSRQSSTWVG
mgnify:CR=1 FL=1